jgi:hypothetical protein
MFHSPAPIPHSFDEPSPLDGQDQAVTSSTAGMDLAAPPERGEAADLLATARQVGGTVG